MIRRWLAWVLAAQTGVALALAGALAYWWPPAGAAPHPAWTAAAVLACLAGGVAAVLLVRLLISANNFRLSRRAASVTPPEHRLDARGAARLFLHEFSSSMLTSSYFMLRPFGLRLGGGARGLPVLLIHGYCCNSGYWRPLSARLAAAGISHYGIDLEPPGASIDDFVPAVTAAVEHLCARTGARQVVIVAHSMGGLVARAYLRRHGRERVARVITLGTPHGGTALAHLGPGLNAVQMREDSDWLAALDASEANLQRDFFSSIYSVHDNIVAPQNSSVLPGARNLAFGGVGHVALGRHPAILRCIIDEIASAGRG